MKQGGPRSLITAVLLGALGAVELSTDSVRQLSRSPVMSLQGPQQSSNAAFWFDPDYADFLDAVRRLTPPTATVTLTIPPGELYLFTAAYSLAPRRAVLPDREREASVLAIYGTTIKLPAGTVTRIPQGFLVRR